MKNVELLKSFHVVMSSFWARERVPPSLKKSIIRPFLKERDKDQTDTANYRPISLLNTWMKVYEAMIKYRLVRKLDNDKFFSGTQAAYRRSLSKADQIFALQELVFEYRFYRTGPRGGSKPPLYLCFLDFRKAFDTVCRDILFRKLYAIGITGKMFRVIKDLYSSNKANILVSGRLSRDIEINSGVMQGSILGPILFNIFINDLLEELHNSPYGAPMGNIRIAALGFADDVVLISDSKQNMQKLLDICESWGTKNRMAFNMSKCKAMVFNRPPRTIFGLFKMRNQHIKVVKEFKYLGITLSTKRLTNLYTRHFAIVMEKAKRRLQCIRHLGFHADGLRIETAIRMYKLLVRPLLEYGAQVLIYRNYYLPSADGHTDSQFSTTDYTHKLEHFQTQALKRLLKCPKHTSSLISTSLRWSRLTSL